MTKFYELKLVVNDLIMQAQTAHDIFEYKAVIGKIDRLLEDLGARWHQAMMLLSDEEKYQKNDKLTRVAKIMLRIEELRVECVQNILELVKYEM